MRGFDVGSSNVSLSTDTVTHSVLPDNTDLASLPIDMLSLFVGDSLSQCPGL